MKRITLTACAVLLFTLTNTLLAQNADPMKAWVDFMTPGTMHKWMSKHVGTWEAELSQWMDASAPPNKLKATDVVTMSMNGL
jgi:hypothetical protein